MRNASVVDQQLNDPARDLWKRLVVLRNLATFMQTGAHPDDESSKMLAKLSLGEGMHVVYVNAVRGQGGQNALGRERGDDLGVLRTEELGNAMKVLGVDLCWLAETEEDPIRDFGFSKSPDQTFSIWGYEHSLRQMIKAVRFFKPDVLCPTFLDVAGQHGHHRAITRLTIEAFEKSPDPRCFPELDLPEWKVSKLYLPAWSGGGGSYDDEEPPPKATTFLDVGEFNFPMGGTYTQIGEWSRSFHATQGMGVFRDEYPEKLPLHLLKTNLEEPSLDDDQICSGIPGNWEQFALNFPQGNIRDGLKKADELTLECLSKFPDRNSVATILVDFVDLLKDLTQTIPAKHKHRMKLKLRQAGQAAASCCVLKPRFSFLPEKPVSGKNFNFEFSIHKSPLLDEEGFKIDVEIPQGLEYKLKQNPELIGNRLSWKGEVSWTKKQNPFPCFRSVHSDFFNADKPRLDFRFSLNTREFEISASPDHPFTTLPEITCSLQPEKMVFPTYLLENSVNPEIDLSMLTRIHSASKHELELIVPSGFETNNSKVLLDRDSHSGDVHYFKLTPKKKLTAGLYSFSANLDQDPTWDFQEFYYPHIGNTVRHFQSLSELLVLDLIIPKNLKVGWIDGGFDRSWYWAQQMGFSVTLLSDTQLRKGEFEALDTIVIGTLAAGNRPVNEASNLLKKWVQDGGRLVSQYHRPMDNWNSNSTVPGKLEIGRPSIRWRITDPSAPVELLEPDSSLMNFPNKIESADWEGWVKERGLYFASEWDPRYQPLIRVADPNESSLDGGLLEGHFGNGSHIHCALNLFYQMENLVPGAFRIFANLLSHEGSQTS